MDFAELKFRLTLAGLILTALVSFLLTALKIFFFSIHLQEITILIIIFLTSFFSLLLLFYNRKLLLWIQVGIYLELLAAIFYISYYLHNVLILLWVYLTILSVFSIAGKKIGLIISIVAFLGLVIYINCVDLSKNNILTLIVSYLIFVLFSYVNISIVEIYENDRKNREKRMNELIKKDYLTGVFNRRAFFDIYKQIHSVKKCILMLDLDHFKMINDMYGHHTGDKVLKTFAQTIQSLIRQDDLFARIGGEEFVIVMSNVNDEYDFIRKANEIRKCVENIDFGRFKITVSIGGYIFDNENITDAIQKADKALYKAKEKRNSVVFWKNI